MAPTLLEVTRKNYAEQAKWFLNAFWSSGAKEAAEDVWTFANKFIELDHEKKKNGNELDEFWSHKFLESQGETLTVVELRQKLSKIDQDKNKKMALMEYLLFKYDKDVNECLTAPQDDNQKEIQEASAKFQEVANALTELQTELDAQQKALEEQRAAEDLAQKSLRASTNAAIKAKSDEEAAKKAESEAKLQLVNQRRAEEIVKESEAALQAAVNDLQAQETAHKNAIATLEAKANDASSSDVKRGMAVNELAQLKSKDPLPLSKAKITQQAALKKVEKERKAAEAVTAQVAASHEAAEKSARTAEDSARTAERAKQAAEDSAKEAAAKREEKEEQAKRVEAKVRETEGLMREAEAFLEAVKQKGGVAHGAIWWMERELKEAQKYLPKKKQTTL